jgi:hypothetical protein
MKTKQPKSVPQKSTLSEKPAAAQAGWLSQRQAIRLLAAVSILLAVWTTWQLSQQTSFFESILWGLGFGASIWLVAGFTFLVTRWLRPKR